MGTVEPSLRRTAAWTEGLLNMVDNVWQCGDCGRRYPKSVPYCVATFDDYLAVNGGSVDAAIEGAVQRKIRPLVVAAQNRLNGYRLVRYGWKWTGVQMRSRNG